MSHSTHQIEVSADGQDITITVGDYTDADARAAISVVDAGGDGSLAYNNGTGVITYTGPSANEVRAHFSAGTGINITNGVITNTSLNTDTTYTQNASATTGGANLNLVGSDATTDTVKFASGAGITVSRTDADTINIASTITQYTDAQARQAISVAVNTGDGDLTYNNTNGQFSYAGPTSADYRGAIGVSNASGDGSLSYSTSTGVITYTGPNNSNYRGAISVNDTGGDGSLSYDTPTGVISYAGPTTTDYRAAIGVSNASGDGSLAYSTSTGVITYTGPNNSNYRGAVSAANSGTGYGALSYDTPTGTFTFTKVTDANIRGAVSAVNSGTGYGSLAYDSGTGAFTYTKVSGTDIRTEVQDGRNLTYSGSTLDLDKALVSVNSVTSESATDLTFDGKTVQLKTRDVTASANTLNINSTGYRLRPQGTAAPIAYAASATTIGTTSQTFNYYDLLSGTATSGSNIITGCVVEDWNFAVVDANTLATILPGRPILDGDQGIFQFGVKVGSVGNITGTYNSNPALNTQTFDITVVTGDQATSANAQANGSMTGSLLNHYVRNSDSTIVVQLLQNTSNSWTAMSQFPYYRNTYAGNTFDGDKITPVTVSYAYTGTQDWQINPRRVITLGTAGRVNEHVNVPFALTIGDGAVSTNRGIKSDFGDARGITVYSSGLIKGNSPKTVFNMTQYTDGSFYDNLGVVPYERCGGSFIFNHFRGNENTASTAQYALNGDGLGGVQWFARTASSSLPSSTNTPAGIYAKATEDFTLISSNVFKQGTGMYLQYTPNNLGAGNPRTFVRAEDATTDVLARTTLRLGKINTGGNGNTTARSFSATPAATWVTVDDTAVAVNSNLRITGGLRTYGEFWYNATITPAAANTVYTFPLNQTNAASGTSISNTSRINISRSGFYKVIMSLQVSQTVNSVASLDFWLRKDGVDVANSATQVDLLKDQKAVIAMDWLVESTGSNYFEIAYAVSDTSVQFPYYASQTSPFTRPAISPLIVNVIPIGA